MKARREDTLVRAYFGAWIVKHIDRWFAFAKELGLVEQMEEIILVTGCDHTRSWTNVAFFGNEHNARATFGVKVEHGPVVSIEWQSSPEQVQGAVLHRGPDGTVRWFTISLCHELQTTLAMLCASRTYPRINACLFEDFVSPAPSGYCQSISKLRAAPLQTRTIMTLNQTSKLFQWQQVRR